MFAGVARYVCRPQVDVVIRMEAGFAAAMQSCAAEPRLKRIKRNAADVAPPSSVPGGPAMGLAGICGHDTKLVRMVQRHLDASPCKLTRSKGIDLDTMLRRDHSIPLDDFMSLSTVNRKILLLDSLKRHNADVDCAMTGDEQCVGVPGALSASQRHDLILERGRGLLVDLHRNAKAQRK